MGEIYDDHMADLVLDETPSYRDPMHWIGWCDGCGRRVMKVMSEEGAMFVMDNSRQTHRCLFKKEPRHDA